MSGTIYAATEVVRYEGNYKAAPDGAGNTICRGPRHENPWRDRD